jgi:hypothetical protein
MMKNLHCVANKSEIFQLKKDSVEMFSSYILEVNLKNVIILNLFYLDFYFGPHIFAGNSSLRVCGVVAWLGIVRNIILLHTHIILPQHLTNKQLFSSHHTTSHLTRSEKLPLHQRQLTRSNCWTLDHWMLGSPVAGMTPLAHPENLLCPHMISLDVPAFSLLLSQTSSNIRFGDRNPALICTLITDCLLRKDCSVQLNITQLEQVVMQCNVISFQLFYGSYSIPNLHL